MEALGLDLHELRLTDLSPPVKSRRLNRAGRTLKITPELLISSSCGISRAFGDAKKVAAWLADGNAPRLRRRLASDVKALYALYRYGALHGSLRLRWGFIDDGYTVFDWMPPDSWHVTDYLRAAQELRQPVDIVVGAAVTASVLRRGDGSWMDVVLRVPETAGLAVTLVDAEGAPWCGEADVTVGYEEAASWRRSQETVFRMRGGSAQFPWLAPGMRYQVDVVSRPAGVGGGDCGLRGAPRGCGRRAAHRVGRRA